MVIKKAMVSHRNLNAVLGGFTFFIFFYLFWNRHTGLGFFDASEYALHFTDGGISHAPGYPIYTTLGILITFFVRDPFLAEHLICLGSLLAILVCLRSTFKNSMAFCLTAITLLSSFYIKFFVILPETQIFNLALFSLQGLAIRKWYESSNSKSIFFVFLTYGLGICHHHSLALTLPAFGILFFMKYRKASTRPIASLNALYALIGLAVGILPLLFIVLPVHSGATYNFRPMESIDDFLALILRRDYGTFSLSKLDQSVDLGSFYSFALLGLIKNFNYIGALLFLGLFSSRVWKRLKDPVIVWALVSLVSFFVIFIPQCNIPLTNATYQNTFLRFLTVPILLSIYLLHPIFESLLEWLHQQHPKYLKTGFYSALVTLLALNLMSASELRFRHFDFLDEHIQKGYQAIFNENPPARSEFSPKHHKCVIFLVPDTLYFSTLYYNERLAEKGCFIVNPGNFINLFIGPAETWLRSQILTGISDSQLQQNPEPFFKKLKQLGYRIFLFYQPDFTTYLTNSEMGYLSLGPILEITDPSETRRKPEVQIKVHTEYFNKIDEFLDIKSECSLPSRVVDTVAWTGLFQNLYDYERYESMYLAQGLTTPDISMHAKKIRSRINSLLFF